MDNLKLRLSGMGFFEEAQKTTLLQVGAGGIGSWFAFLAISSGISDLVIYDDDTVDEHNIGGQFFNTSQKGKSKVEALDDNITNFNGKCNILTMNRLWDGMYNPIMVSCVDNMKTRKEMFDLWESKEDREVFIDGRLGPDSFQVYFIQKGQEQIYRDSLFLDEELPDLPCTQKQTKYMAFGIASTMMEQLCNYLTNKKLGINAYVVPSVEKNHSTIKKREYGNI